MEAQLEFGVSERSYAKSTKKVKRNNTSLLTQNTEMQQISLFHSSFSSTGLQIFWRPETCWLTRNSTSMKLYHSHWVLEITESGVLFPNVFLFLHSVVWLWLKLRERYGQRFRRTIQKKRTFLAPISWKCWAHTLIHHMQRPDGDEFCQRWKRSFASLVFFPFQSESGAIITTGQ